MVALGMTGKDFREVRKPNFRCGSSAQLPAMTLVTRVGPRGLRCSNSCGHDLHLRTKYFCQKCQRKIARRSC